MTVPQKESESLREFLARFCAEVAEIPNLIDELAINYLAAGVDKKRHGLLLEEFFDKNPRTLQAAMQIFEHRLTLQEAVGSIQSSQSVSKWEKTPSHVPRWEPRQNEVKSEVVAPNSVERSTTHGPNPSQRPVRQWPPRPREERDFTKLNTDKATILAILKTEAGYRPPRPMNPNRAPSSKYCDYHEDTGHTTERCFQLGNLIEEKLQKGQLVHFIQQGEEFKQGQDSDRLIDVIFGGSSLSTPPWEASTTREVLNLDTKRPRKNPTPIISFSDEDFTQGLIKGHQDALVITTKVGPNTVKKLLVDDGSVVDILYFNAFSRMDLGDRKLNETKVPPLFGFTGNEVRVVGTIDLPVLFSTSPCQSWQMVKFHVVNAISSHNGILGRPTLAALGAIVSIAHLKVKFATEHGVGEVRGDQQMSRQCYVNSLAPKRKPPCENSVNEVIEVDPNEIIEVLKNRLAQPLRLLRKFPSIQQGQKDPSKLEQVCPPL